MKNLIGQVFGKLTVVKPATKSKAGKARWLCRCECGKETIVQECNLLSGNAQSCGCVSRAALQKNRYRHGGTQTKLYYVWKSMHNRCEDENVPTYGYYGGRGITVCDEWQDFAVFREWAEQNGYAAGLSIDRIDTNGPYEPSNCRWIPLSENIRKMSTERHLKRCGQYHGISPEGKEFVFENANAFAREHELDAAAVRAVARGDRNHHKGWHFYCA